MHVSQICDVADADAYMSVVEMKACLWNLDIKEATTQLKL